MLETVVGIVGIVVTIISIIVTLISIVQTGMTEDCFQHLRLHAIFYCSGCKGVTQGMTGKVSYLYSIRLHCRLYFL